MFIIYHKISAISRTRR